MKSIFTKSLWILVFIVQSAFLYAQTNSVTGKLTDQTGETLIGATIVEKGTNNGTITDFEGVYILDLETPNAVLVFSYTGYKNVEITASNPSIDVQMELDVNTLDEVVVTGIRGAQLREVSITRNANTVIEAITPVDIGSFSDDNVADALQRVAGVQIERNVDGVSGDRVSIRGIGPQFVKVTMNGRTPISAGSEGRSDMRKFNMNMIPTEIISGARIHKTSQANEIATDIGGTVDFQSIRPLNQRYKNGKNYFASINARGSSNSALGEFTLNPRASAVFAGKINDKLGAAISVLYADEKYFRQEAAMRGYRSLDFREDTNNDGIFNTADGDQLYEDILVPATHNNSYINDNRRHIGIATAIQFKATEKLEFLLDYNLTEVKNDSDRQFFQISLAPGGNNGLLGQSDNNFFSPGSFELNGNNLLYLDAAGASLSRANLQNRNTFYDNYTTNNIAGLNTRYQASDKLSINLDFSYSDLDFFQNLKNIGTSRLDGRDYDNSGLSFDLRGERPFYGLPDEAFDPAAFELINTALRQIRTKGYNYASRLDFAYDLNKKTKLSIGARYATTDFETREGGANSNNFEGYTEEQKAAFIALRSGDDNLTTPGFLYGDTGLPQWINTPGQAVLDYKPEFAALDGGSIFDFNTPIRDVIPDDNNLFLASARSYGALESSFASYAQVETDVKLFNVPVYLNFGLRAINTKNESRGFTGVGSVDPNTEQSYITEAALYHEVENSRWDILPSFNANFKIKRNFQYRVSVARGASRPRFRDMVPSNDIDFIYELSEILDPNSSNYTPDLESSVYRGTIRSGNPNLEPYSAWMFDNTFEYYVKNGGQFRASVFYKDIKNYIGRQTLNDQPYPGEEALGYPIPAGQENLLFDITTPINITNAQLYGFEIGFNQHFTFLPGFAKGLGLKANYALVESNFDGAVGDATNGFPGSSKHNINGTMYYEKYGISFRFTAAYRSNYLSNLGGIGSTRADEAHYTNGFTTLGCSVKYKFFNKLNVNLGVNNLTGVDVRRYIGDDTRNLTSYYRRDPIWKIALRYKLK